MSRVITLRLRGFLFVVALSACGGKSPSAPSPTPSPTPSPPAPTTSASTAYTDPNAFRQAAAGLGTPTTVDFDDLNAPAGDTISGRTKFDGNHYASRGLSVASPDGYDLYIAPGGSVWNASNSLSVGRFPFDPMDLASDPADSLTATFSPGCRAVSFEIVDNATHNPSERVEFHGAGGALKTTELPADYSSGRAFVGLVTTTGSVTRVLFVEDANDGDDVTFDDFTCFR